MVIPFYRVDSWNSEELEKAFFKWIHLEQFIKRPVHEILILVLGSFDMKEITGVSGACADQARITIRFDLKGKLKKLVDNLIDEGFKLGIDDQGDMAGKLEGSYEEISRMLELLKIGGFRLG